MTVEKGIEQALDAAKNDLQSGEHVLTVGTVVHLPTSNWTKTGMVVFAGYFLIFFATLSLLFVNSLYFELTSVLFVMVVILGLFVVFPFVFSPLIDAISNTAALSPSEVCIITNRRVLVFDKKNLSISAIGRKSDVAKILSEKGYITLTMNDGTKKKMLVVEGLRLAEISASM